MIIDIDMGNSRIKWRSSACPGQVFAHDTDAEAQAQWRLLGPIARVRIAAVIAPQRVEQMLHWVRRELHVDAELATVRDATGGIHIAYSDPSSLGVDRWLALLAAKTRLDMCDCIIVSAGTALTIDYLDASANHRGGYIIPGWRLAVSALLGDTDRIHCSDPQLKKIWQPGASTLHCVEGGIALMYRSTLRAALQPGWADFRATHVLVTGGDGEVLSSFVPPEISCLYDPALVLQGLDVALP